MDPRFESVHADGDSSFRCLHFRCESFAADHGWHYHPEYELTWVIRSAGMRFVGDSIQAYGPGDLVLLGPELPHCWQDAPGMDGALSPEVVVAQFRADCFGPGFLELDVAWPIRDLLARAAGGLAFPRPAADAVGRLLLRMARQHGLRRLARLLEVLAVLAAADGAAPLASADYRLVNDITPANRRRIELVHRFVREHLDEEISQAEMARRAGLSPPAFSRFFKVATGTTFVGFVNAMRVNEACRLLAGTAAPVTRIALSCGYRNMSNFNRQFLALRRMNPSEYRRRAASREGRGGRGLR